MALCNTQCERNRIDSPLCNGTSVRLIFAPRRKSAKSCPATLPLSIAFEQFVRSVHGPRVSFQKKEPNDVTLFNNPHRIGLTIKSAAADAQSGPQITEKPQNGIAGLKHWRHDLLSGFIVSLISMPFSLGIAMASGAPPITGITSAIIAGFVLPFIGGSYVTIGGPAAGLAPVLLAGMVTLGHGDLSTGYPLLLVAICLRRHGAGLALRVQVSAFRSDLSGLGHRRNAVRHRLADHCQAGADLARRQVCRPRFLAHSAGDSPRDCRK